MRDASDFSAIPTSAHPTLTGWRARERTSPRPAAIIRCAFRRGPRCLRDAIPARLGNSDFRAIFPGGSSGCRNTSGRRDMSAGRWKNFMSAHSRRTSGPSITRPPRCPRTRCLRSRWRTITGAIARRPAWTGPPIRSTVTFLQASRCHFPAALRRSFATRTAIPAAPMCRRKVPRTLDDSASRPPAPSAPRCPRILR